MKPPRHHISLRTGISPRDENAVSGEHAAKAADDAAFLVDDLRALARAFCKDKPTLAERLAEAHALNLLARAAELKREIVGLK